MPRVHVFLFAFIAISAYCISADAAAEVGDVSVDAETEALVHYYREANFTTEMVLKDLAKKIDNNETKVLAEKQRSKRSTQCRASRLYGGTGGTYFADIHHPCPRHISAIVLYERRLICSIQVTYKHPSVVGHRHGRSKGKRYIIELNSSERIVAVVGRYTNYGRRGRVYQLAFVTVDHGKSHVIGPYGRGKGAMFLFFGNVVSFRGRSGHSLDAIGFYYTHALVGY